MTAPTPYLDNTFWMGDRVSPACDRALLNEPEGDTEYHDPHFGHVWGWTPKPGAALYGRTRELPAAPIDAFANGKFLRMPFRRAPIIDIRSVAELHDFAKSITTTDDSIQNAWRGQVRQYDVQRPSADRLRLYGDVDIQEPSLIPSASRTFTYFPTLYAAWSGLLDLFTARRRDLLGSLYLSAKSRLDAELERFTSEYKYRLWGLATAQHYGVPSVGLDLTSEIDIALFFALNRFAISTETGAATIQRAGPDETPIIYGLGVFQNDLLRDEDLSPPWLQCARPRAQKAMFFTTAWGASSNKAAERIYCGLRLVGHHEWRSPLAREDLFPRGKEDVFVEFLLEMRGAVADPLTKQLLSRIYFLP